MFFSVNIKHKVESNLSNNNNDNKTKAVLEVLNEIFAPGGCSTLELLHKKYIWFTEKCLINTLKLEVFKSNNYFKSY